MKTPKTGEIWGFPQDPDFYRVISRDECEYQAVWFGKDAPHTYHDEDIMRDEICISDKKLLMILFDLD